MPQPDMTKFLPMYFEETGTNLDLLEDSFRALGAGDDRTLEVIVRAAHSIKGSSDAFGFVCARRLSGALEHIWRPCLEGKVGADFSCLELCLDCVGMLREVVLLYRLKQPVAEDRVDAMLSRMARLSSLDH